VRVCASHLLGEVLQPALQSSVKVVVEHRHGGGGLAGGGLGGCEGGPVRWLVGSLGFCMRARHAASCMGAHACAPSLLHAHLRCMLGGPQLSAIGEQLHRSIALLERGEALAPPSGCLLVRVRVLSVSLVRHRGVLCLNRGNRLVIVYVRSFFRSGNRRACCAVDLC
jgi:hypothetical protein